MCSCNCNRNCNCERNHNCNCNRDRNCNCNRNRNLNYNNSFYEEYRVSNMNCSPFPINYLYGHAYTPNQIMTKTFEPAVGLKNGTMFPELVSPYYPGQSIDFINYLRNGGM